MNRHVVFVAVGSSLLALGVLTMIGCGSGCSPIHLDWSSARVTKDGVELPHTATLRMSSPEKVARLALDLESASIVIVGDATVAGIEAEYEVREKTPGDASLAAAADGVEVKSAGGFPVLVTSARLRVKPATVVDASTNLGDVRVTGIRGAAEVTAKTDAGSVALSDLEDVATVEAKSNLGEVTIQKAAGLGAVALRTASGAVSAKEITSAATVTMRTDLGSVRVEGVTVSDTLSCATDAGSVKVDDVRAPRAEIRSNLGGITASRCTFGHVKAHTNLGSVRLRSCTYETKDLGSDLGRVTDEK